MMTGGEEVGQRGCYFVPKLFIRCFESCQNLHHRRPLKFDL